MNNYLSLVNKDNKFNQEMVEGLDFTKIDVNKDMNKNQEFIENNTLYAFNLLKAELEKRQIIATINSAGRTIEEQKQYFDEECKKVGEDNAKERIALPGHSEHHLGLAIDVRLRRPSGDVRGIKGVTILDRKMMYKVAHSILSNYGFILRYPKGKSKITKVGIYEPWHFRYVGVENAKEMERLNLCLEEYVEYLNQKEQEETLSM